MIKTYTILHGINQSDKNKLFTISHQLNILCYKKRSRSNVRANTFSNRVVDTWNSLPENVVNQQKK